MSIHGSRALLALALVSAVATAQAAQADIKVWADIDTTLALRSADGSVLPLQAELPFNPATGTLSAWSHQVRVFSNDITKDVDIRVNGTPELRPVVAGTGAKEIKLAVELNGRNLETDRNFTASELFDGALPGASVAMPLRIGQEGSAPITAAGLYEGVVSIVLTQLTVAP